MNLSTREKGKKSEVLAISYLEENGFSILEKNWHSGRFGEIDIIAKDLNKNYLVFIEVKSRNTSLSEAKELVTKNKQKQIVNLAKSYLYLKKLENTSCRFDVIAIKMGNKIQLEHIRDAF